jgi:hypothetical protein
MNSRTLAAFDRPRTVVAGRRRPSSPSVRAVAILVLACLHAGSAVAADTALFRVILKDGTALTSYGEYARVGSRIVFSMPFGSLAVQPQLQIVSLPESAVDWEATERYADSVRYARYLETRAEADYASLTGEIARRLNELSLAGDAQARLEIAEQARRLLFDWPATHFGYRSQDVREMVALLDEVISDLRAKAGAQTFDLSLVAIVDPPAMPLLSDPTPEQTIDQAMVAARITDNSVERATLLQSVIAYIDRLKSQLPRDWARRTRASASSILKAELKTDQSYAKLRDRGVSSAQRLAAAGDVAGVSDLIDRVTRADEKLGRKRPAEIDALVAHLEMKLDAARRLRLAQDRWTVRSEALLGYRNQARKAVEALEKLKEPLAEIRALAGPDPRSLKKLRQRVTEARERLIRIVPPPELATQHATLLSACQLAGQAVDVREQAILRQDMRLAWDASAAASGSTMLMVQAWSDMQALFKPPELQ